MSSTVVNMLFAKKVKLHGMKSDKWTTKDKILQYKGLINLYTRDRKIIEHDTNVNHKKLTRELQDIQKSVHNDRRLLDNAIRGDKQQLRNTLSERKELQLAFQNSQPRTVIEQIDQLNFNRRKVLDKLKYEKKLKSRRLTDLKLEHALLEDQLKYAYYGQIRQEKEAQIITGKVQDAILRKEAAWAIHHIYREILDIMKKDALYFDVIIATVRNDGYSQSKCFLGATKLGQLATEYLDDRRQEFATLEKIILKDMATRKTDIKVLQEQVDNASASIKQLVRKDSDITTCMVSVKETPSFTNLKKDVELVEKTLLVLKNATLVPSYQAIYPCLQEQVKQKKRLRHLAKKCERDRDIMQNKTNHAELMVSVLRNSMVETTSEYTARKKELNEELNRLKKKKDDYNELIRKKRFKAANLKIGLRQLLQLSDEIKDEVTRKKSSTMVLQSIQEIEKVDTRGLRSRMAKKQAPEEEEAEIADGTQILPVVLHKVSFLMQTYFAKQKEDKEDVFKPFETMMQDRIIKPDKFKEELDETSLLQGLYTETSHEPTREDIKKQSKEIVDANTKNEDLVPLFFEPKKSKFSKKAKSKK